MAEEARLQRDGSRLRERVPTRDAIGTLLGPSAIAFVGASQSEEKMAGQAVRNVRRVGFAGGVFPVNSRGAAIDDLVPYTSIADIPGPIDVGFLSVPAESAPEAIRDLAAGGAKAAILAVGGFAESGSQEGRRLQEELECAAGETGIRLVGPVCNGVYNTRERLALGNNVIHTRTLEPGNIALVSHSGALAGPFVGTIEDCSAGLSHFISCGSEADLRLTDFMDFLVEDEHTEVIALVLDHVGDGEAFRSAVRRARQARKPVVALKLGDSALGRSASATHSSHLAGAGEIYEAVFRSEGVIQVSSLETLAITCAILSDGRRPRGRGVVACSTSGGGAILLADRLSGRGVPLPSLAEDTREAVSTRLRFGGTAVMNPFDLGLAGQENYGPVVSHLAADPGTGVLVAYGTMLQTPSKRAEYATSVVAAAEERPNLPVVVLAPGALAEDERSVYSRAGLPVVRSTLDAVAVAQALVSSVRESGEEASAACSAKVPPNENLALGELGGQLSEWESKRILADSGVSMPQERFVTTEEEALEAARHIGYPVVLKACGRQVSHKSDHQLVAVQLTAPQELIDTWHNMQRRLSRLPEIHAHGFIIAESLSGGTEVFFGVTRDPEFGPVAVLGPGGVWAELFGTDAMRHSPLPLTETMIRELIDDSPLAQLLAGYRGSPTSDTAALRTQLARISTAAEALGDRLTALDVNPLLVREKGGGAFPLDAFIELDGPSVS